jgi:hypothetical protein
MKLIFSLFITLGILSAAYSQDSIIHRVIFIGDAGEMSEGQKAVIEHAADNVFNTKTSVVYLGDNIYPRGLGLPGTKSDTLGREILQSQYQPLRSKGAAVYFVPGNHDWDKSGSKGLAKIKQQWQYLDAQADSLLKMLPPDGCPDPIEVKLANNLVLIIYDSEWWLFPFQKTAPGNDCECNTRSEILVRMEMLRYKNRNKFILLASHHPFQSYGVHGGKYSLKDYLFPFTNFKKWLYIPLPLLYPVLRSAFPPREDLKHPLYKNLRKSVNMVFDTFPNVAMIAGHEHGMQLIKNKQLQIVSGAGAKHTHAKKGEHSLFANSSEGYVTADLMKDNSMRFTFYVYKKDKVVQADFPPYSLPFTPMHDLASMDEKIYEADSVTVQVHPSYNKRGKFHRLFFGENYREEWAAPTTLPVIRISTFNGGLTPLQRGGGMQSQSLRLADKNGKEWVIRSVEKSPDALLPPELRESFARDWIDDVTSAQHPFSALIVPPIANAVDVPHANPVIGVIAPDKSLGIHARTFSNMIALVEEREPLGESDNSAKMKLNLQKDNDNSLKGKEMLRARMLDMLLGDWDRHEDQWRWFDGEKGKAKEYVALPRDRDQVFHLTQGLLPKFASRSYVLPTLRNFDYNIRHVKWLLFKTKFVNAYPSFQFNREEWNAQAKNFQAAITDSVLETALRRLPKSAYDLRHDVLLAKLKSRRNRLPAAMDEYYRFIQKIADIQTSDKSERVQITDAPGGGMNIRISKINKSGEIEDELMNKTFDPALTKEVRLYVRNGNDSIIINHTTPIKLRIIGGDDKKNYQVIAAPKKIFLYDKQNGSSYSGDVSKLKKHISNDTLNVSFAPVNLYNTWMPLTVIGLNLDDGFIIGTGFKFTKQEGFRKFPYAGLQQVQVGYAFSTGAYRIRYTGEWIRAIGKADFVINALAKAPNNTINFFGRGNETVYNKTGDFKRFYRTRYSTYQLDPVIRWRRGGGSVFSIGPSLYAYTLDRDDNAGRFINSTSLIGSYDSATIDKNKFHLGVMMNYTRDKRNSRIIPQWGSFINIRLQAYNGIGKYSKSFAQLIPELALYKSLNARSTIVLAERMGGIIGFGDAAFYQSAYIGGHENLLGYRQYRFAGQHSFYNNLELRIKIADIASYIIPGQFGITGFWDVGRVWEKHDNSGKWHHGKGGGIYFAPASIMAFSFVVGHSGEGLYPYFTMGLRF